MPAQPRSPSGIRLVFEPYAGDAQRSYVVESLDFYNVAVTGLTDYHPVNLFLKSRNGEVLGGLLGHVWGQWLYVRILWVAETLRRGAYGTRLLDAAEGFALDHGCVGSYLDTYSFQGRPFYEKRGYRVIGTIEDCPPGHAKYFLMKRFGGRKPRPRKPRSATSVRRRGR